jgi:hypothetical protein
VKIEVEHFPHGCRVSVTYRDSDGLVISYRYSLLEHKHDGSHLVSYFTPSGKYFKEKLFPGHQSYESVWRFMWRTAIGVKG